MSLGRKLNPRSLSGPSPLNSTSSHIKGVAGDEVQPMGLLAGALHLRVTQCYGDSGREVRGKVEEQRSEQMYSFKKMLLSAYYTPSTE